MSFQINHLPKIRILNLSRALLIAATAFVGFSPSAVLAATATTTFQVSATVAATCVLSATNLAFGSYSGVQSDITSTVTATCTNTTPYTIGLSAGASTGALVTTRAMTGPAGALLNYSMFRDSARSLNWGNTAPTDTVGGTGNGSGQALTVYGRIAAGQYVAPGAYTDTITATVTF
jgi:spore coat protein U-like protein